MSMNQFSSVSLPSPEVSSTPLINFSRPVIIMRDCSYKRCSNFSTLWPAIPIYLLILGASLHSILRVIEIDLLDSTYNLTHSLSWTVCPLNCTSLQGNYRLRLWVKFHQEEVSSPLQVHCLHCLHHPGARYRTYLLHILFDHPRKGPMRFQWFII